MSEQETRHSELVPFEEGVFLVVADDTEEFPNALRYAARLAQAHRGRVGIAYVIEGQDFQHWGNIEQRMREELRKKAEDVIWNVAKQVNDWAGVIPSLYILEGNPNEAVLNLINEDFGIKRLILGGSSNTSGPGPMISYFSGKALSKLRVPLVIVPGHMEAESIDSMI